MDIDIKLQLKLLKELQDVDMRVRAIDTELSDMPKVIEETRSRLLNASLKVQQLEKEKIEAEKEKRDLEAALEDSEAHLKDRETKLYSIKTNKEYQAAIKEVADGKRANKEREDAILKIMEKNEQISQEITQLSSQAAEEEVEFEKEKEDLDKRKAEIEKEKESRLAVLKPAEAKVEKEILEKYNYIRQKYLDPVAAVISGVCQGCNMNIPPQMYIELLKCKKLLFCPNCYRFIYSEEEKQEADNEKSE